MLERIRLTGKYGSHTIINKLSLHAQQAEAGLAGPSGPGKSPTVSRSSAVLEPSSGDILIVVPQDIALDEPLNARENKLKVFVRLHGLDGRSLQARRYEVFELIGLSGHRKEDIVEFSGGMQRSVNIGVALMNRENGKTAIYSNHCVEEVELLCSRVAIADQGRLLPYGTKDELKHGTGPLASLTVIFHSMDSEAAGKAQHVPGNTKVTMDKQQLSSLVNSHEDSVRKITDGLRSLGAVLGRRLSSPVKWANSPSIRYAAGVYGLALGSLVLCCGLLANNHDAISSFAASVLYESGFSGGLFFDKDAFPPAVKTVQSATPNGKASNACLHIFQGGCLTDMLMDIFMLAGAAAVFFIAVLLLAGRKGQ